VKTFVLPLLVLCCACGGSDDMVVDDLTVPAYDLTPLSSDGGISCGGSLCDVENGNVCCVEPTYEYCGNPEACSVGIALYCNGPGDCPGQVCCLVSPTLGACLPSCSGTVLCHVDADCPNATPHCCLSIAADTNNLACAASCS
jgi:hypothetical protein